MNIKKWLKYAVILFTVLIIIAVILFNRSGQMIYGGLTKKVDYTQFVPLSGTYSITNVHVLSPDAARFIPGQTVIISDNVIQTIDTNSTTTKVDFTVDGTGQYLIPGLIDAHVHLFKSPNDLLLYVANGVTEIRELIGEPAHLKWRSEIENGRIGPKMFVASPRLGSFEPLEGWFMKKTQGFLNVKNAEEARRTVKDLYDKGYDGIKIYSQLNKESYEAITETASELGMPTFGHIPWSVSFEDIYNSGQSGIAHLEEVMNGLNREFGADTFGNFYGREEEFLSYVATRSVEIADQLIVHDITVTTTLWLVESFVRQKFELDNVLAQVALPYENPGISEWANYIPGGLGWLPEVNRYKINETLNEDQTRERKKYWNTYAKACQLLVKKFSESGVTIMAGTDANLPPTVPGFSLHDELQSLYNAGMSTAQVIRSATVVPSKWLQHKSGSILPGYKANLVLLDANPLLDISNTTSINTVIVDGKLLDRSVLDEMLVAVKEANNSSRKKGIGSYVKG